MAVKDDSTSVTDDSLLLKSINLSAISGSDESRYIAGYANVADIVDAQNDVIKIDVLKAAWDKWIKNPDFCIFSLEHSNIPLAKLEMDEVIDSTGKKHKSGMDSIGLYVVAKLRSDIAIANDVWKVISSGAKKGFSIAGEHLRPPKRECEGDVCYKVPQEIELHEIAIVGRPANPMATFSMLKGDDSLFKLSEVVKDLPKRIEVANVEVSKTPDEDGKYPIYAPCFCRAQVADALKKYSVSGNFKFVDEMCPKKTWVSLFDFSLSRPVVVKTADDGNVGSNPSGIMNKPTPEKVDVMVEKSESKAPEPVVAPAVVAPPATVATSVAPVPTVTATATVAPVVAPVVEAPKVDATPHQVEAPPPVVAPVAPAPAPIPQPVQAPPPPVVTVPSPPPAPIAEKPKVSEPVVVQRGKVAPTASPTGFDLSSLTKLTWRDINRLRGDNR